MVLRALLNRLLNHPEIIDKLADSPPIRSAARAAAGVIVEGQAAAKEIFDKSVKGLSEAKRKLDEIEKNSQNPKSKN